MCSPSGASISKSCGGGGGGVVTLERRPLRRAVFQPTANCNLRSARAGQKESSADHTGDIHIYIFLRLLRVSQRSVMGVYVGAGQPRDEFFYEVIISENGKVYGEGGKFD